MLMPYCTGRTYEDPLWRRPSRCLQVHRCHANTAWTQAPAPKLDNKADAALQQYMREQDMDFQLLPPHVHCRNAAERAIRTFKNHFIAGLCSTEPDFPLLLWDKPLPQALMMLNLLRGSRINPPLSGGVHAQIYGALDFN